ncbi:unnamed protein product [Rotaria socialis]|uniref:CRAL-TRIO domain-containing protein n=1 Tax=Rotaria socialis TaxID=392032 RepID=A0A817Z8L1_9BILA|nr:unnamed protein product [Rotaria socialis]CAF3325623.1 unnamed protein product [Rotaria socialis]CAF3388450.1 unnamed protein product [Rotaria socialis]CAF3423143.1 unnamed protein product [Rotaria socialis]CAF3456946.1 unnamed protein product [Rotaria socialis]
MTTNSPLFDINQLNSEHQKIFHIVYDELKPHHTSYVQYKIDLQLKTNLDIEDEDNEWRYEVHRYLRARKWHVTRTIKCILEMIQWRKDHHVDSILEEQETALQVELLRKIVPNVYHGNTKDHLPLYIEKSGLAHVDKILNMFTPEGLIRCHIYILEYNCQLTRECSRKLGKHVETFAMISDLNGCKMDLRKVLHLYRQAVYIDENFYPERLGHMLIVNPPVIFPILWNLVKHWLDPVTQEKIIVMKKGHETATTLLRYIDSDNLPKEYGGSCNSCPTFPECIPIYDWSKDTATNDKPGS